MRLIRTDNYEQMSEEAAKLVAGQLWLKPASVLGLATGSTPLGLYKKLVDLHDTVGLSFAQTKTFNLDEYVGLTPADEQSYHYFMQKNLFSKVIYFVIFCIDFLTEILVFRFHAVTECRHVLQSVFSEGIERVINLGMTSTGQSE